MSPWSAFLFVLLFAFSFGCTDISPPLETGGADGGGGVGGAGDSSGHGGSGGMAGLTFDCTEEGIRDAIAEGGGPHTFDCGGPTRITTDADFFIDAPVILDGEENLILDGGGVHRLFEVGAVAAELRAMTITNASQAAILLPGSADLTIRGCTISDNLGYGVYVGGGARLTLLDTTVSGNEAPSGAGVFVTEGGDVEVFRSTISSNEGEFCGGFWVAGALAMTNSTVSGNTPDALCGTPGSSIILTHVTLSAELVPDTTSRVVISMEEGADLTMTNSVLVGACRISNVASGGYNIESPFDSCGLRAVGDQVGITSGQLSLGPLQANGGSTRTHLPGPGRAIDAVGESDCEVEDDQRGIERFQGARCDVGSVEVVP